MNFTWCKSKTQAFTCTQNSKGPKTKKKCLPKNCLSDLVINPLILFVIKMFCDLSVQTDVFKKISLVNSISNQMIGVWCRLNQPRFLSDFASLFDPTWYIGRTTWYNGIYLLYHRVQWDASLQPWTWIYSSGYITPVAWMTVSDISAGFITAFTCRRLGSFNINYWHINICLKLSYGSKTRTIICLTFI